MDEELLKYCEDHSGSEDKLLQLIKRQTHLKVLTILQELNIKI